MLRQTPFHSTRHRIESLLAITFKDALWNVCSSVNSLSIITLNLLTKYSLYLKPSLSSHFPLFSLKIKLFLLKTFPFCFQSILVEVAHSLTPCSHKTKRRDQMWRPGSVWKLFSKFLLPIATCTALGI